MEPEAILAASALLNAALVGLVGVLLRQRRNNKETNPGSSEQLNRIERCMNETQADVRELLTIIKERLPRRQ